MPFRTIIFSFSTSSSHDWGLPGGSDGKESACHAGDLGLVPGSERSPGEGFGNPLQYSCLENPLDRGDWQAAVHGVSKSRTRRSDLHFHLVALSPCSVTPPKCVRIPTGSFPYSPPSPFPTPAPHPLPLVTARLFLCFYGKSMPLL